MLYCLGFVQPEETDKLFLLFFFLICFDMLPFVFLAMGKAGEILCIWCVLLYGWLIDSLEYANYIA